ncbi:putative signal peptide-containing protein [Cryptosporidium canis]|uniref:Signal peptide-containing protein n=1 Tax=Cryptosporidium canis TaxID=195482 RepID=A0ABQ8PBR8_9CRYT|nr:putative signal peptide-containing protein [Cryptosporidium canis]
MWYFRSLLLICAGVSLVLADSGKTQTTTSESDSLEDLAKKLLGKFESMEYPGMQNITDPLTKVVYGPFFYEINNVSLPLNITSLTGGAFNPPSSHESAQYYYESFVTEPFVPEPSDAVASFEARKVIRGGVGAPNGTYVFFQEEIQLLPNSSSGGIGGGIGGGNGGGHGNSISNIRLPEGSFAVNGTRLPVGTTSFGPVTFPNGAILPLGALLPNGTLLSAGTKLAQMTTLPGGTLFPGGATFLEDSSYKPVLTLNMNCNFIGSQTYGYRCSNKAELKPDASCCITNTLCYSVSGFSNMTSVSIPAGGILPSGSNLPNNSLLLGSLTISTNTIFGGGAILPNGQVILPNTTVPYGTILPAGTFIADTIYLETGCVLMGGLIAFGSSPFTLNLPAGSKLGLGTSLGGGAILKGISYLTGGAIFPNGTILQPGTILQSPTHPDNVITETSLLFNYHLGIQDNLSSWVLPSGTLLPGGLSNRVALATLQGGFYQFAAPFGYKNAVYKSSTDQPERSSGVSSVSSIFNDFSQSNGQLHPYFDDSTDLYRTTAAYPDSNPDPEPGSTNLIGFRVLNYQIPSSSSYLELPQQMLLVDSAFFPSGLSSNGPILFSNGTVLPSPVIFKSKVILPPGTFIFGTLLTPNMRLNGPSLVLGAAVLPPSIRLSSSTSLPSKAILPGGAFLPLGGVLTGDILYPSGKTLQSGTSLSSNTYIKPNALLTNGLILPGGGIFPGGIIIPNGQFIQSMSVPPGTMFPSTSTLLGTVYMTKGGALLPGGAVFSGNNTVPSGSQLLSGAVLSQGTILPGGIIFQAETKINGGVQISPLNSLSDLDINQEDFNPENYPPFFPPQGSDGQTGDSSNNTYITAQVNITNFYYKDQSQDSFSFFRNLFSSSLAISMGFEPSSILISSLSPAENPYNISSHDGSFISSSSLSYPSTPSYFDTFYSADQKGISVTFEIHPRLESSSLEDIIEVLLNNVIQNPSSSFNRVFSWVGFMILTDKSPNFWTRHLRGGNRKIIKIPYLANTTDVSALQDDLGGIHGPNQLGNSSEAYRNQSSILIDHIDTDKNTENVSLWGNSFQIGQEQEQEQD